ncbi:MAG TPA: hypothetical protein VGQ36_18535, partial [Thermoanaerobaculia bacterium]|nr:hypothetical protein [Thermoanaerobaculia bacterium]
MEFGNLVLSLMQLQVWSITPALPRGAAGTRMPVGDPEIIPDVLFITRELGAADGFPPADRAHLNGFIQTGRLFHET